MLSRIHYVPNNKTSCLAGTEDCTRAATNNSPANNSGKAAKYGRSLPGRGALMLPDYMLGGRGFSLIKPDKFVPHEGIL